MAAATAPTSPGEALAAPSPQLWRRYRWWRAVPPILLVLFLVWLGVTQPNSIWIGAGTEFAYLATAALGLQILVGYTGQLSLGHAAFFLVGGYAGGLWTVEWGLSPYFGFPVAFAFGCAVGAVLAVLCVHLKGFYLTVVTLGFGYFLQRAIVAFSGIFGSQPRQLHVSFAERPRYSDVLFADHADRASDQNRLGVYIVACIVLLVTIVLVRNLVESRFGRACKAVRDSEIAAKASGVGTYATKVWAFALSAGFVAMAGVVPVMIPGGVSLETGGQDVSFRLVTFLVIGGVGTVAGPVVGTLGPSFILSVDWIKQHLSAAVVTVLFGLSTLLTVATQPEGAMGAWRRQWELIAAKWRGEDPARAAVVRTARPSAEDLLPRPRTAPTPDGPPVLEVTGLAKRFGGLAALSDVDLVVKPGTVHALIGPNGSGKSTFVNVVSGFYDATEGTVRCDGKELNGMSTEARARLGLSRTFQNLQVWKRMTVLENVMVGLHDRERSPLVASLFGLGRRSERRVQARAMGLLTFVGLDAKANATAGTLAFADQRRLEIARALAADPVLLLLDEPAAGMHPTEVHDLTTLVRRIGDAGISVLLIEHHMDIVMELSDHVTVLDYGRVIASGPPDQVRTDQRVITAYLGADAEVQAMPVGSEADI